MITSSHAPKFNAVSNQHKLLACTDFFQEVSFLCNNEKMTSLQMKFCNIFNRRKPTEITRNARLVMLKLLFDKEFFEIKIAISF